MDRNDLRRKIDELKASLQPKLNEWHALTNAAKDDKGNPRAFTAEEFEKHTALAGDIDTLTAQIEAHRRALKAAEMCDRADEETAEDLRFSDVSQLPHASDEYRERFHNVIAGNFSAGDVRDLGAMVGNEDRFRNLTGTSPSTGSVLIPTILERNIMMEAAANSALFGLSGSIELSGRINSIPFIAHAGVLGPRAEGDAYVLSEPTLAPKSLTIYNFGGFFPVAMELLEDAPALEATFGELASRSFADTVEEYGLKGTGGQTGFTNLQGGAVTISLAGKVPTGLFAETTANVPELETAAANAVGLDDILKLPLEVHAQAMSRAAWIVSKEFLQAAILLKDDNNRPLWLPSLAAGQPATLNGAPVHRSDRMGAITAGAFPALFGNFKDGHKIALRKGITIKKSEHYLFGNNMLSVAMDVRFGALATLKKFIARLKVKAP